MADQSIEAVLKRIDTKTRGSANQIANEIAILMKNNVQEYVYDAYDAIRAGNVTQPYKRTGDLINKIEVIRGRGQAKVVNNAHDSRTLDRIQTGETNWKNSVLYKLDPSERARPFMEITINEVDRNIENYFTRYMGDIGIQVLKK